MDVLNAQEAYTYLDGLTDDRDRSAALAIHLSYMDYCSSLAKEGRMAAETPLDMALLYRAAVAAFHGPPIGEARGPLPSTGRVVNRDQVQRRLATVSEGRLLRLASRFMDAAIRQSDDSPCDQDLLFLLDLFLMALRRATPKMIESGEISEASRRLEDTDYW